MTGIALSALCVFATAGCFDIRDLQGTWRGDRIGDAAEVKQGFDDDATAELVVVRADLTTLDAALTIEGLFDSAPITPIPGAEADVLASASFDGSPARVYLAFADTADAGGPALVIVAVYDADRLEVRVLRGGAMPLYGIFSLARAGSGTQARARAITMGEDRS